MKKVFIAVFILLSFAGIAVGQNYSNASAKMTNERQSFNNRKPWRMFYEAAMIGSGNNFFCQGSIWISYHGNPYLHFAAGLGMVGFDKFGITAALRARVYTSQNNFSPFFDLDGSLNSIYKDSSSSSGPKMAAVSIGPGLSWNLGRAELYLAAFYQYNGIHGGGLKIGLAL